jgi:hypothetical protein
MTGSSSLKEPDGDLAGPPAQSLIILRYVTPSDSPAKRVRALVDCGHAIKSR